MQEGLKRRWRRRTTMQRWKVRRVEEEKKREDAREVTKAKETNIDKNINE